MISDSDILGVINEKGILRFSTLMVRFRISSNEAIRIVADYKKKGIIGEDNRPVIQKRNLWKSENVSPLKVNPVKEKKSTKKGTKKIENAKKSEIVTKKVEGTSHKKSPDNKEKIVKRKNNDQIEGQLSLFD